MWRGLVDLNQATDCSIFSVQRWQMFYRQQNYVCGVAADDKC